MARDLRARCGQNRPCGRAASVRAAVEALGAGRVMHGVRAVWDPVLPAAGVRCSLNADDPLLFDTGLVTECVRARDRLGISDADLVAVARASLAGCAAPPAW